MEESKHPFDRTARVAPRSGATGEILSAWTPQASAPPPADRALAIERERGRLCGELESLEAELFRVNLRRALRPAMLFPESAKQALKRYIAARRRLSELRIESLAS
jgi:hypothetical protein